MDMKPISFFFASRILNLPISQNHRVDRYLIFTSKIVKKMNLKFFLCLSASCIIAAENLL